MDLFNDPEFLAAILKDRERPSNISSSMEKVLQNTELPQKREEGITYKEYEDPSIFWKGLPIIANLADALSVTAMRKDAYTDKQGHRYGVEKNPIMRGIVDHPEINIPLKLALGFGVSKLATHIGKKTGNKTIAKMLSGLGSAIPSYGAYTNIKARSKANKAREEGR